MRRRGEQGGGVGAAGGGAGGGAAQREELELIVSLVAGANVPTGKVQGRFREGSGKVQGRFREGRVDDRAKVPTGKSARPHQ